VRAPSADQRQIPNPLTRVWDDMFVLFRRVEKLSYIGWSEQEEQAQPAVPVTTPVLAHVRRSPTEGTAQNDAARLEILFGAALVSSRYSVRGICGTSIAMAIRRVELQ
jgi:hypothetical protein